MARFLTRGTFLLLLAALGVGLFWPGDPRTLTPVDVRPGSSAHDVMQSLKEKKLLRFPHLFLIWIRVRGAGSKIKVGRYLIAKGRSAYWMLDDLIKGRTIKIEVVIPEGFASWQIAERLKEQGICDSEPIKREVALRRLEGYLFPATYDFDVGLDPTTVLSVMQDEFGRRWTPELATRAKEIGWSRHMVVTMASILEREARVAEEFTLVSSLYHNRLKKKMLLQADPTVQYGLGFWKPRLTFSDYRNTKSLYNTYLYGGLPPGPICSPGAQAIRAALWPAQTQALYMVAKDDGRHDFSQTLREHTNKVNRRNRDRRLKKNQENVSGLKR